MSQNILQPYGAVPSPRQLQWHALEIYGFVHFSMNTFTGKEWGFGDEPPSLFNPAQFDAAQIAGTFAAIGLKGLILTCKHHDGFCLWPSKFTEHSVKNSPWRNGQGDMVREFSDACQQFGLKFGVYLSPWDRNYAAYGQPEYLEYYRAQLRELLTQYGPVFEVWFDGANGGDGFYGGANETRTIDNRTYYDWENTWQIVRELQPDACMFSDGGPDIRWVGNERGFAGDPCWATINAAELWPGHADRAQLNRGDFGGTHWLPAEVDVSVRPGWFFHPDETIKTVPELLKIYFESIGRGANLHLNLTPDPRGLLPEHDVNVLKQWHQILDATFAKNLASGASVSADDANSQYPLAAVLDASPDTFWSTNDEQTTPQLVVELPQPVTFNVVSLREYLPLGLRVEACALDFWDGQNWQQFAATTSIGNHRLIQTPSITTSKVRLLITRAAICPAISEFGLFAMPALQPQADERQADVEQAKAKWKIVRAEPATSMATAPFAIDDNPQTLWVAEFNGAAEIVVDMGEAVSVRGFSFLPRQDGAFEGTPDRYAFSLGDEAQNWQAPAASGEFSNIESNPILQRVAFDAPATGRYFRFQVLRIVDNAAMCAVAQIGIIGVSPTA